jgi:hypothetical protein
MVDEFIRTHCVQHNRESTRRETERILKVRLVAKWRDRDLCEIG